MSLKIYKLARKIHKWTSIAVGFFLLIWLISGIYYVLPLSVLERLDRWIIGPKRVQVLETQSEPANVEFAPPQAGYRNITVSIPEAISILETEIGHAVQVAGCSIHRLSDTLVYEITLKDGGRHLVDAIRGIPAKITEARIRENAIAAAPPGSNMVNMSLLTKRPYAYWGPIPVYRSIFDDAMRTYVYVSPITGQVQLKNSRLNRSREWMSSLHKFEFLMLIWERQAFRKGMLLIFSLVTVVVVITGFYMALPIKLLRRLPWNRSKVLAEPKKRR